MQIAPTETIAKHVLFGANANEGLSLEVFEILWHAPSDDALPWSYAEMKLKEMLHVVQEVQKVIAARRVRKDQPELLPLSAQSLTDASPFHQINTIFDHACGRALRGA